eukprot:gnl/MRDRNA2_/MRDRNA2_68645_c0_seq1.p1 gnl/MRDRNA2_/MRDRNA2_68645_c0~~gnl/MRDRNA2_/MRDRNA2_68645_c0_seq1.p1  ORF type:complete len:264 (+),score=32.83 gnl/MRDRNA2_/MRDRNA2_68645_c0_seq1:98-889(+)
MASNKPLNKEQSSMASDEPTEVEQWSVEIPSVAGFSVALLSSLLSSGGLILGVGAFLGKAIEAGHIGSADDAGPIFDGAFQIMTWGSLVWSLALEAKHLGPRFVAVFGATLAAIGHCILGYWLTPGTLANRNLLMVAYGFLGFGGNGIFFASVSFAHLFPGREGLCNSLVSGAFNGASCMFLLLNLESLSFAGFFQFYGWLVICIGVTAAAVYPDSSYAPSNEAAMSSAAYLVQDMVERTSCHGHNDNRCFSLCHIGVVGFNG